MTVQEAKKELRQWKHDALMIERREAEIAEFADKIRELNVQCCENNEQGVRKLEKLYAEYINLLRKAYCHKLMVETAVETLSQPYQNILRLIYFEGEKLEEVAVLLGYNYSYLSNKHTEGVALYAEKRACG